MAGDISSYALSVEFQLADKFTPTLNLAEERLTRIEEQISNIAAKGMVQFQQVAAQIETSVSQIAIQYNKIHDLNMQLLKPAKERQMFETLQQRRLLDETAMLKDKMFAQWLEINKVLGVKQGLLDAEHKTLGAEAVQVEQVGTGIGFWVDQINKANVALKGYLRSLVDVNSHTKLALATSAKFHQTAIQIAASDSQIADQHQRIHDLSKLILKPIGEQQAHDLLHQRRLQEELGILKDRMGPQWSLINKRLVEKQKLLDVEGRTLDNETGKSERLGESIGYWGKQVNEALRALKEYSRELLDVVGHFRLAMDASERFHHANLRLVDTQSEMARQAQELAAQHGLYREAVLEAYQALGDVKVPREAFAELAVASAQFSRLSGVSVKETVTWQKSLLAAGVTAAEVERRTGDLALAMRKFGLSSRDVNGIMADQEQTMTRLANNFGPMAQVLQRSQVATAAFAKQLDATESEIAAISQAWTRLDSTAFNRIRGQVKLLQVQRDINTVEGQQEFIARAAIKLARERLSLERQMRADMARSAELSRIANRTAEQQLELEQAQMRASNASRRLQMLENRAIANYMPVMGQAVNTLSRLITTQRLRGKTEEEIMRLVLSSAERQGNAQENLARINAESTETFTGQLRQLKSAFQSLGAIFNSIEPDLVAIMKVINVIASSIIGLILRINNALTALGAFGRAIRIAIIVVIALKVAFGGLHFALGMFGRAAHFATGAGRTMGTMLEYTLKGLARGLKALATYVPTMLALAALMLAVGAAAYLLALAVVMIAQQGMAGVKALAALTVAIIALGVGLAFAGSIASEAWPGLLALAAVLLAAGVAAYLFALAVVMVAQQGMAGVTTLAALTAAIIALGIGLAFAGIIASEAWPGLLALAAVLLAAGVAAYLFALAVQITVQSLQLLNADLGKNVAAFIWELFKAAPILILAGGLLIIGAAAVLVASVLLLVAGALLWVASYFLLAGAQLFTQAMSVLEPGANLLSELAAPFLAASIQLMLTGLFIFLGGLFLLVGGALMLAAAAVLVFVGPALWFASWSTEKGLKAMRQSGQWANEVGVGFQMGGTGLYQGGLVMLMAGDILAAAGRRLHDIADELAADLELLGRAARAVEQIGPPISAAGAALYSGGLGLLGGASFLQLAVNQLRGPARELEDIAGALVPVLTNLATALIISLESFGGAAQAAGQIGPALGAAGRELAAGLEALATAAQAAGQIGPALEAAGRALYSASLGLMGGASFLQLAINQLRGPARELEDIAGALVPVLTNLAAVLNDVASKLTTSLGALANAAQAAGQIGPALGAAGAALYSGGLSLSWGALFLQSAVKQLRDPARELEGIAGALVPVLTNLAAVLNDVASKLTTSLEALANAANLAAVLNDVASKLATSLGALANAAQAAGQVGPALEAVGRALYSASLGLMGGASFLQSAVNQLRGPARELEGIAGALVPVLTNLAAALAIPIDRLFYTVTSEMAASAQALYSTLDSVVFVLTVYANRLEAVANRIATNLRRAAPALSFSLFGLAPIRAETIVTPAAPSRIRQADEETARQEYLREVRSQSKKLDAIKDKLEEIRVVVNGMGGKGPGAPLGEILELLRTHLPEIASGSSGVGSYGLQASMTDWMR